METLLTFHVPIEDTAGHVVETYSHFLQLYRHPPEGRVALHKLEEICMERLEVLKYVEDVYLNTPNRTPTLCRSVLIDKLKRSNSLTFLKIMLDDDQDGTTRCEKVRSRRLDHISHFMLRAAFSSCKSNWFFVQETSLFEWRLSVLSISEKKEFLDRNKLSRTALSREEKLENKEHLRIYLPENINVDFMPFYKVPFHEVPSLVEEHKVFVKRGVAFVPETELNAICVVHFEKNLRFGLEDVSVDVARASKDSRITDMFRSLIERAGVNKLVVPKKKIIDLDMLDDLSKASYPLCMRRIHESLKSDHHLKYHARIQYILFLKSIGVKCADTVQLLLDEFKKRIDEKQFRTEHGYRIRHLYGEVGSQKHYRCQDCSVIMDLTADETDSHGCPFKHLPVDTLCEKLHDYGVSTGHVDAVTKLSENGDYLLACKKYYEILHDDCLPEAAFKNPVTYFFSSLLASESNSDRHDSTNSNDNT